jgi:hypothetical protein
MLQIIGYADRMSVRPGETEVSSCRSCILSSFWPIDAQGIAR